MIKAIKGLLCVIAFSISSSVMAQTIEGLVKSNDTKHPIQYAIISVVDEEDLIVGAAVTDTIGYFIIDELLDGQYKMTVEFMGYQALIIDVEVADNNLYFDELFLVRNEEKTIKEENLSKKK